MNALALSSPSISSLYFISMSICFFNFFDRGVTQKLSLWGGVSLKTKKNMGMGKQSYQYFPSVKKMLDFSSSK